MPCYKYTLLSSLPFNYNIFIISIVFNQHHHLHYQYIGDDQEPSWVPRGEDSLLLSPPLINLHCARPRSCLPHQCTQVPRNWACLDRTRGGGEGGPLPITIWSFFRWVGLWCNWWTTTSPPLDTTQTISSIIHIGQGISIDCSMPLSFKYFTNIHIHCWLPKKL